MCKYLKMTIFQVKIFDCGISRDQSGDQFGDTRCDDVKYCDTISYQRQPLLKCHYIPHNINSLRHLVTASDLKGDF